MRIFPLVLLWSMVVANAAEPIDRHALVTRHNPTLTKLDPLAPLSVGNGEFAFTADITGLQTFPEEYEKGISLHTQAQWGWHSFPNSQGYKLEQAFKNYDTHGRAVPYAANQDGPAASYLRGNPHRLDLGRIGLILKKADGTAAKPEDLTSIKQTMDLWSGILTSEFQFDGQSVKVRTACHPRIGNLAVQVDSPLVAIGRVGVLVAFPGATAEWKENANWDRPDLHRTTTDFLGGSGAQFARWLDDTRYFVSTQWSVGGTMKQTAPHLFELRAEGKDSIAMISVFAPEMALSGNFGDSAAVFKTSTDHWQKFWTTGAAVDFSGSTDPRAQELERRVVLSQYLTAIQCAGSMPPQETGLTFNSWFGKPHTEMTWWHEAQFALWGRAELMERMLPWFQKITPVAKALAERQGYAGVRWPKMVGPEGEESPSKVAAMLIWQQPHPIYYAELCYRAHPDWETLQKYRDLVMQTAEFMASFAWWNDAKQRYELGPPLIPAQECYDASKTFNPTYELAYWHWALGVAQTWRERLGLPREAGWDKVRDHLAKPNVRDGVYTAVESAPFTETHDHPSMLCALGVVPPTPLIDPATMSRTYDDVLKTWQWPTTWGWDYPVMAMTAARLGRPDDAVAALLMDAPKNRYLPNGHNYQDARLPIYLPGNGGLLYAVAMMAAGWDSAPTTDAPGFPKDGKWKVRSEGLLRAP